MRKQSFGQFAGCCHGVSVDRIWAGQMCERTTHSSVQKKRVFAGSNPGRRSRIQTRKRADRSDGPIWRNGDALFATGYGRVNTLGEQEEVDGERDERRSKCQVLRRNIARFFGEGTSRSTGWLVGTVGEHRNDEKRKIYREVLCRPKNNTNDQ